jgi:hypothetical protein
LEDVSLLCWDVVRRSEAQGGNAWRALTWECAPANLTEGMSSLH